MSIRKNAQNQNFKSDKGWEAFEADKCNAETVSMTYVSEEAGIAVK